MKYEIKSNRYSLKDNYSANALSVGFVGKKSFDQIKNNLEKVLKQIPLACSKVVYEKDRVFLENIINPFINFEQTKQSDKVWIAKQFSKPLRIEDGELIRFSLLGENTFVIFAHPVISDSRGLMTLAKAILDDTYEVQSDSFYFPNIENVNLSLFDKLKKHSLSNAKADNKENLEEEFIKVKTVSLKSDIIFRLCSGEKISLLSFFITTALSLNKTNRKKIGIPFCKKINNEDLLINDSPLFMFKRGLEPRLSFYDNGGQIDKLLESIIQHKNYEKRATIINSIPSKFQDNPNLSKKAIDYVNCDLMFDYLPSLSDDDIIKNMSYYSSSSYVTNGFGICAVDGRITISAILHNKEGEKLFSDYQTTINLLSKTAAKKFKI